MKKSQFNSGFRYFKTSMRQLGFALVPFVAVSLILILLTPYLYSLRKELFDGFALLASGEKKIGLWDMRYLIILLLVVELFMELCEPILGPLAQYVMKKMSHIVQRDVADRCGRLELDHYEVKELHEKIIKANAGGASVVNLYMNVFIFFLNFSILFAIVGYLSTLHPLLAVIVLISQLTPLIRYAVEGKYNYKLQEQTVPLTRENDYYQGCFATREYYKDTLLMGTFSFFFRRWKRTFEEITRLRLWVDVKINRISLLLNLLKISGTAASLILSVWFLFRGEISLGAFSLFLTAVGSIENQIGAVLFMWRAILSESKLSKNYFDFFKDEEEHPKEQSVVPLGKVELNGVSYTYPTTEKEVIHNLDLTINPGERIALVGVNGSGKSTLVKLITGLYKPTVGRALIGGADTATTREEDLFVSTSAVFQNYSKYKMTVEENIAMGRIEKRGDTDRLNDALKKSGFDLSEFPGGTDTLLGREFGGIDLSGGQWQRLAIARGLFRSHDLIVFDEPTAAIDPLMERELYKRFIEISEGKTAVLVTHRLGSARLADRILMLQEGRVIEEGTHEKLMERDGEYARMFTAQAQWFER